MKKFEVEVRSFISDSQYRNLIKKLKKLPSLKEKLMKKQFIAGVKN
jgi:hypothetical protein